jgi:hypothetical protein
MFYNGAEAILKSANVFGEYANLLVDSEGKGLTGEDIKNNIKNKDVLLNEADYKDTREKAA